MKEENVVVGYINYLIVVKNSNDFRWEAKYDY